MKRLVVLVVILTTIGATAQRKKGHGEGKGQRADLTVEQLATLQTKKMTLALDLSTKQQKQVMEINLEDAEMRKAKHEERQANKENGEGKPTADERFAMQNALLDHQIAQQQKMKEVLTEDQYEIWKKIKLKRAADGKKKMKGSGSRG